MAKTSTERNREMIQRNKAKGMRLYKVWVLEIEREFLKEKLKEYRSKKGEKPES